MQLYLHNSLTRQKESFIPLNTELVKMYVCGPTVYDAPHIGNARSEVIYDLLYRLLRYIFGSEKVLYVRNITDVDDKIIDRSQQLDISISELTKSTTKIFQHNMAYLGCLRPNIEPKATEHITEMIEIIQILLNNGCAYLKDGHVYFDVTKAEDYHRLSGRQFDKMRQAVRIELSELKNSSEDFILWKPEKTGDAFGANFSSPWGKGRPGWHIECSAMSHKYLGKNFDIHGGGSDLIFPHHTNEIAQSVSAFPGSHFARYWIHNGFLTVEGTKMSKSLGNFITVNDLEAQGIDGNILRLLLLSNHYRSPLDFNQKLLHDITKMLAFWHKTIVAAELKYSRPDDTNATQQYNHYNLLPENFLMALFDDINTAMAFKIVNDYAKLSSKAVDANTRKYNASVVLNCLEFVGFNVKSFTMQQDITSSILQAGITSEEIECMIEKRREAKLAKNWQEADNIRQELQKCGITLEDYADGGVKWFYTK